MRVSRFLQRLQDLRLLRCSSQTARVLQPESHGLRAARSNPQQHRVVRGFHRSPVFAKDPRLPGRLVGEDDKKRQTSLVAHDDLFEQIAMGAKSKATFAKVIDVFNKRDIRRRGHVEFIYAALRKMPEFGVERDLGVYNRLLDVFPKEVFVPTNFIQRMFNHYPRQQECGVQLLEQMENYGITPNVETKVLLVQIFGEKSHPMRKYQRLMYWFPKFKHLNPFPVPHQLPEDPVDLARFSLTRIANDLDAKVTVHQLPCSDVTESGEEIHRPYILGIQSPGQRELLAKHDPSRPVFVEGPFPLWLRSTCVYYYVLRADPPLPQDQVEEAYDPERSFYYPLQLDFSLDRDVWDEEGFDVEDLDEGPVYAMCMAGCGDQATLGQWISDLQQENPVLGRVPTLFRLDPGPQHLQGGDDDEESDRLHVETEEDDPRPGEDQAVLDEEPRRGRGKL
uniref:Evolutionarily conserved signaling intermediate in Toll pathway, mitochondrial n=1 Tax=Oryzias latipes TaxID=8090 RepID=A0A3P9HXK9_ORYLA